VLTASPRHGLGRALAALARGHVTVRLARGLYPNASIRLGSGARLLGGPGVVLRPPASYDAVVTIAGADVTLSGVTIDGGGPGAGDGHAVLVDPSSHVLVRRLTVVRARQDAVYMWGALADVSVQDSRLDGGGVAAAGVVAGIGEANDVSVVRTRISGFREFGINFAQVRFDLTGSGLRSVALDNVITDIRSPVDTQGRSQGGIWSGGAAASIIGNRIARTGWDGIETVGSSDGVSVAHNVISSTRTGIYLEHATTRSQIAGNSISDVVTGINVEYRYQGVGSGSNTFGANRIARASQHGIFIDTGSDKNVVQDNRILMSTGAGIVLQGSSWNAVRANVLCGPAPPGVVQQTGQAEDGSPVAASNNTLDGNVTKRRCPG
jgi:parallel beta-helix repeat protein